MHPLYHLKKPHSGLNDSATVTDLMLPVQVMLRFLKRHNCAIETTLKTSSIVQAGEAEDTRHAAKGNV